MRTQRAGRVCKMPASFPPSVSEKPGHYVYLYLDPRTKKPFYVGKGKGNRCFSHLRDQRECEKVKQLKELRKLKRDPIVEILKYRLSGREALLVEAAAIDCFGIEELTNEIRGHSRRHGKRGRVEDIKAELSATPIRIEHPVILINIAKNFHYGMTPQALYDATRSAWRVRESKAQNVDYALAVYRGVVREVYEIAGWFPAGQTMRTSDPDGRPKSRKKRDKKRMEFVGKKADEDVRRKYVGHAVKDYWRAGSQNPIRYADRPAASDGHAPKEKAASGIQRVPARAN